MQRFAALPELDWSDPNLTFIDLTGDGLADVLMTEDGLLTWYPSLGGDAGFDTARLSSAAAGTRSAGQASCSPTARETIFTADMTGDGLTDIVRIRNGEVCYWPNLGYGRFGAKVTMDDAPRFDDQERFDPRRIRLADIDGSGTADLLYLGADGVRPGSTSPATRGPRPPPSRVFPSADRLSSVQVLDLLGNGTPAWSGPRRCRPTPARRCATST